MNINEAFPSNYIKASDLKGAQVNVIISHVEMEEVGREKDRKPVLYFEGKEKGLVLNKTNARKIIQLTGSPVVEEWKGRRICLYPTETAFGGEQVECVRVKTATSGGGQARTAAAPVAPPPPQEPESEFVPADQIFDDDIPF